MSMSNLENENTSADVDQGKPGGSSKGGFIGFITLHNTTIIAIILSVAAMLGNNLERMQQEADEAENEISQRHEYLETESQSLDDEIDELDLKYDSTTVQYAEIVKDLKEREDSLNVLEKETEKVEIEQKARLEHIEKQNKTSNMADTIFQVAILLSSVSLTSKNKKLVWLATLLTAAGVIAEIMIYFV